MNRKRNSLKYLLLCKLKKFEKWHQTKSCFKNIILDVSYQKYVTYWDKGFQRNEYSDRLISEFGVKQGDNFAPTGFCCFINGLLTELNQMNIGIPLNTSDGVPHKRVCVLAYADDIILLAENDDDLQSLLDKQLVSGLEAECEY